MQSYGSFQSVINLLRLIQLDYGITDDLPSRYLGTSPQPPPPPQTVKPIEVPPEKTKLMNKLAQLLRSTITREFIGSLKTVSGNTQSPERTYIAKIKEILQEHDYKFEEAPSQQSKDFRNVRHASAPDVVVNIEVKKADTKIVTFNDTMPNETIEYVIFYTKDPTMVFTNGNYFAKSSPWTKEYKEVIDNVKDKYCRGDNKKKLEGCMQAYARPTFKADISELLQLAGEEQRCQSVQSAPSPSQSPCNSEETPESV